MSVTVEYVFNSEMDLGPIRDRLAAVLGCDFQPYEGNESDLFCCFLGSELTLQDDHGLIGDRDLNFPEYRYILSSRTAAGAGAMRPIQIESMALVAYTLNARLGIDEGMLSLDVQVLLARYRPSLNGWFDEVSGKTVAFPGHLHDLRSRCPEVGRIPQAEPNA